MPYRFGNAFAAFYRRTLAALFTTLQLQTNVNEIIRRPWSSVLERKLPFVLRRNLFHFLIELSLTITFDQKRCVHDHAIADRLVGSRGDGRIAQLRIDLTNVGISLIRQRSFDQTPELHAREVS